MFHITSFSKPPYPRCNYLEMNSEYKKTNISTTAANDYDDIRKNRERIERR